MMISHRQVIAESPNKYPWNPGTESKDPEKGNPQESKPLQTIIKLKMDKERLQLAPGMDHFTNWETINQLGTNFDPALHVKNPRAKDEKPKG